MRSSRPCAPVPRFSILPPPVVRKNRTRASTHAQRLVVVVTTSSFFGRHPVVGLVREWRSGRSSPLLPFVSGGRDPSPERIATTKRSLEGEVSRRHEHSSQSAREEDPVRGGSCVPFTGDAFPPGPAVGPRSGRNDSIAGLLLCARPESLGKRIPCNSGPVPMTAGRFPV